VLKTETGFYILQNGLELRKHGHLTAPDTQHTALSLMHSEDEQIEKLKNIRRRHGLS